MPVKVTAAVIRSGLPSGCLMLRYGQGLSLSRRRIDDMIITVAGGTAPPDPEYLSEEGDFMSDFEMLYLMLTLGLLIVGILNLTNKK